MVGGVGVQADFAEVKTDQQVFIFTVISSFSKTLFYFLFVDELQLSRGDFHL